MAPPQNDDVSEREDIQDEDLSQHRRGGNARDTSNRLGEEAPPRFVPPQPDYGYGQRDGSAEYRPLRGGSGHQPPQPFYLRDKQPPSRFNTGFPMQN